MKHKVFTGIAAAVLICGMIFLAMVQLESVDQSARSHAEAVRKELRLNIRNAVVPIIEELNITFSWLSYAIIEAGFQPESKIYERLLFIKDKQGAYNAFSGIFLLKKDGNQSIYQFDFDNGMFENILLPEELEDFYNNLHNGQDLEAVINKHEVGSMFFMPLYEADMKGEVNSWIIIDTDVNYLFSGLLPEYIDKSVRYSYEIVISDRIIHSSRMEDIKDTNRRADFIYSLDYLMPGIIKGDMMSKRGWSMDFLKDSRRGRPVLQASVRLYYPDGPFQDVIFFQAALNKIAGIGVIILLAVSLLFLYKLYIQTQRARQKEQEFTAAITHELRTPIAVIQSTSSNLAQGIISEPEKVARYGSIIKGQAKRLSHMVENILVAARLEGNKTITAQQIQLVDIKELIEGIIKGIQELLDEGGIHLNLETGTFSGKIKTDPLALTFVIENILINSIRHGKNIDGTKGEIRLVLKKRIPRGLAIIIEDNGPGIPEKEQKKVFSPFVRGNVSIQQQVPGSGLGLHLVLGMTEILGGRIELESPYRAINEQLVSGCRFRLDLDNEVFHG